VIGHGFGHLQDILEIFRTVFVIGVEQPNIKSKNLIYRETFDNITQISEIGAVFYDLEQIQRVEETSQSWLRHRAIVVIEGNEPIDRTLSKFLYASFYQCTGTHGFFHTWELKK
jgi:hypothetical protein